MNKVLAVLLTTGLAMAPAIAAAQAGFSKPIDVRLSPYDRSIQLLNQVRFVDSKNVTWVAPKGTWVDGASIPQFAWSLVGGPLDGPYRDASIIHDVYCESRSRPWKQVHRVFYEGLLARDVPMEKALTMYAAVMKYGPRWTVSRLVAADGKALKRELERVRPLVASADYVEVNFGGKYLLLKDFERTLNLPPTAAPEPPAGNLPVDAVQVESVAGWEDIDALSEAQLSRLLSVAGKVSVDTEQAAVEPSQADIEALLRYVRANPTPAAIEAMPEILPHS